MSAVSPESGGHVALQPRVFHARTGATGRFRLLLVGWALVLAGLCVMVSLERFDLRALALIGAWLALGCAIVGLMLAISGTVQIDSTGVVYASRLRKRHVPWSDVTRVRIRAADAAAQFGHLLAGALGVGFTRWFDSREAPSDAPIEERLHAIGMGTRGMVPSIEIRGARWRPLLAMRGNHGWEAALALGRAAQEQGIAVDIR